MTKKQINSSGNLPFNSPTLKSGKAMMFLFIFLCSLTARAQEMRVATFNLRYDNKGDSGNLWVARAAPVAALIKFHDFEIFGIQEGLKNQLDDINNALPDYARFGAGRDDGKDKGEHSAVYYKKSVFKFLKGGNFWLSQTPDKPSLGWDATCCNRICSWVYVQHIKSGKKFYFFNAHFDHQGREARRESSKLILEKIREIAGNEPAIFTGDLNGSHTSEWYLTLANSGLLKDSFKEAKDPYLLNASFNAFGKARGTYDVIDHIFTTKQFNTRKWGVLTDTYHGKFPSDHFPVLAFITLK